MKFDSYPRCRLRPPARRIGELNRRDQSPRSPCCRMQGQSGVVCREASSDVGRQARVVPIGVEDAGQNVDEALVASRPGAVGCRTQSVSTTLDTGWNRDVVAAGARNSRISSD
jgi:hypothetical protein